MASKANEQGRPDVRERRVTVRMSPGEYHALSELSTQSGVPMATIVRVAVVELVNGKPVTEWTLPSPVVPEGVTVLAELRAELQRVGVNLNQIAHTLNAQRRVEDAVITDTVKAVGRVVDQVAVSLGAVIAHA